MRRRAVRRRAVARARAGKSGALRAHRASGPEALGLPVVTTALPLFPLNSVLFPGLVLPLNIFEQRYRALMRDLLAIPEDAPRRFGVVAIRDGREVAPTATGLPDSAPPPGTDPTAGFGPDPMKSFYTVGCVADASTIRERGAAAGSAAGRGRGGRAPRRRGEPPGGGPSGDQQHRVRGAGHRHHPVPAAVGRRLGPYLMGEIEELPEEEGDGRARSPPGCCVPSARTRSGWPAPASAPWPRRAGAARRPVGRLVPGRRRDRAGHPGQAAAAPGAGHRDPAGRRAEAAAPGDRRHRQAAFAARGGPDPRTRPAPTESRPGRGAESMAKKSKRQGSATPAIVAATAAGITFTTHAYEHDPAAPSYGEEAAEAMGVAARAGLQDARGRGRRGPDGRRRPGVRLAGPQGPRGGGRRQARRHGRPGGGRAHHGLRARRHLPAGPAQTAPHRAGRLR